MASDPFISEAFTYLAISILVVFFRVYCRVKQTGFSNIGPDDYLMLLALVPLTIETVLAYNVGALYHGLSNSNMTPEERASLSPESEEYQWR